MNDDKFQWIPILVYLKGNDRDATLFSYYDYLFSVVYTYSVDVVLTLANDSGTSGISQVLTLIQYLLHLVHYHKQQCGY